MSNSRLATQLQLPRTPPRRRPEMGPVRERAACGTTYVMVGECFLRMTNVEWTEVMRHSVPALVQNQDLISQLVGARLRQLIESDPVVVVIRSPSSRPHHAPDRSPLRRPTLGCPTARTSLSDLILRCILRPLGRLLGTPRWEPHAVGAVHCVACGHRAVAVVATTNPSYDAETGVIDRSRMPGVRAQPDVLGLTHDRIRLAPRSDLPGLLLRRGHRRPARRRLVPARPAWQQMAAGTDGAFLDRARPWILNSTADEFRVERRRANQVVQLSAPKANFPGSGRVVRDRFASRVNAVTLRRLHKDLERRPAAGTLGGPDGRDVYD